jgi:hypothetical protein
MIGTDAVCVSQHVYFARALSFSVWYCEYVSMHVRVTMAEVKRVCMRAGSYC